MEYTKKIKELLDSDITSYQIAKDCGLSHQFIDNYRYGVSKIENMALGKAETLYNYAHKKDTKNKLMEKVNWIENLMENAKPETPEYVILKHDYWEALRELWKEVDHNVDRTEYNFKASVKKFNWEHKTNFKNENFEFEVAPVAFMVGTGKPEGIDY